MARSPAEWRDHLVSRLDLRWSQLRVYDAYYEGDQILAYASQKFRDVYGGLFKTLTDNYMPLVVDAAAERLRVQGFRFGTDQEADKDAWAMWQANGLDAESNMVHTEAVKLGYAYWMVQPNGDIPRITGEHPSQVIVQCDPADRRVRQAALKKWLGEDGYIYANVYLPDRYVKYRTASQQLDGLISLEKRWETIGAGSNPLEVVPVVPVANNPSMLRGGRSDLAGGPTRLQDAINKLLADMLVGSEYQAFPQRVLLGIDQPRDANNRPISMQDLDKVSAASRLWMFPGKDAKAFEFSASDLDNFRKAMDGLIGDLSAQTRLPIYYFRPSAISNISAEALIGLDAGLVSKTDHKKDTMGEAHEETIRLGFKSIDPNDPRAQAMEAETIWRNTESRSEAQVVDAAVKLSSIGVPQEVLWERVGYGPTEIDRMKTMKEADALLAATLAPELPPTNGQVPPTQAEQAIAGAGQ